METKDLILLMMIPLILISLVFYVDKNSTITGAATAKQEENSMIGAYSVNPSFRAAIDYDLKDYENIKFILLNEVVEKCRNEQDIEQCLKKKSGEIGWNCKEDDYYKSILYDF